MGSQAKFFLEFWDEDMLSTSLTKFNGAMSMRKLTAIISAGLLFLATTAEAEFRQPIFDTEIAGGYRHDNFHWTIQRQGNRDRKLFKMTFHEMQIYGGSARVSYATCNNYYMRVSGDWGYIYQGNARASRYRGTGSSSSSSSSGSGSSDDFQISKITGKANNGHVMDLSGGIGYQFTSNGSRCILTPMVGWAYHEQHFHIRKATQRVNFGDPFNIVGPLGNLHAGYKPRWYGPWAGMDFLLSVDVPCLIVFGSFEYEWPQYRAKGNWNFDDFFVDRYKHKAHGRGYTATLGFNYRLGCGWYVGVVG